MRKKWLVIGLSLLMALLVTGITFAAGKQEAAKAGQSAIKLVWWSMWNETEPQAKVYKEAVNDYMSQHPKVQVSIQWNGREIRKTLPPALDANTQIDIWEQADEYATKTWKDYALKLNSYYEKTYPTTNSRTYRESIIPALYELHKSFTEDGSLYIAPEQPFIVSSMYNKDLLKKVGVSIKTVGATWEEFLAVLEKLKSGGITPMTFDDAYSDLPLAIHLDRLYGGYEPVEKLAKDKTGKLWDDPRVMQTAKDYEYLASEGYFSKQVATNKWPAGQQEVATNQVAIYPQNGSWLPNELKSTAGLNFPWGQFAYPIPKNGKDGGTGGTFGSQAFMINKKCKNPDTAFDLIVFLTIGKWGKKFSNDTLSIPMDLSQEWPKQLADDKEIFKSLTNNYPWSGGLGASSESFPIVKKAFIELASGKINAEKFVAEIKAGVTK